jgi:HK97 gp10 family phage protein
MKSKIIFKVPDFILIIDRAEASAINAVGKAIVEEAQANAPVKTGNYKNNIKYNLSDQTVVAEAEYSAALEYGVRVMTITPKNAKALRFQVGSEVIFAKSVKQKARPGRAIMRNAARVVQTRVSAIFIDNFKREMRNV